MSRSPDCDRHLRDLAEYLKNGLNTDSENKGLTVVNGLTITNAYAFKDLPLLAVYRQSSSGKFLQESRIQIVYYVGAIADLEKIEGVMRWVEVKIAQLLIDFSTCSQCFKITSPPTSEYKILRLNDNVLLPHIRLTVDTEELFI